MNDITVWQQYAENLYFAFQPIVNIHTGKAYGFEALLRGWQKIGFSSIQALFDAAYEDQVLFTFDMLLRKKAIAAFSGLEFSASVRLFYNIDNRILEMPNYSAGETRCLLNEFGLHPASFNVEIGEKKGYSDHKKARKVLEAYRDQGYRIIIDDFGNGYSGLQLLYHADPSMIKINRFFIEGIDSDSKKKLFVSNIISMAHIMGIQVAAEGVETLSEFYSLRTIECDFVQGYLIAEPKIGIEGLQKRYPAIEELIKNDRRSSRGDQDSITAGLQKLEPIMAHSRIESVLMKFRTTGEHFFPVIDRNHEPVGIISEKNLKQYVYSPFGISLLKNKAAKGELRPFISPCPVVEINTKAEKILEIFSMSLESEGLIVTENNKYKGILGARSLLKILHEKDISMARDQNPLSKLPGNSIITNFISSSINLNNQVYVYFDFDNFKPFNDTYGFRQGDRAIVMFSDMLKALSHRTDFFVGHIGGDDFFAGKECGDFGWEDAIFRIEGIVNNFAHNATSFYSEDERQRGYIFTRDRDGECRKIPLLGVSAAVIHLVDNNNNFDMDDLSELLARLKKMAKKSSRRIAVARVSCNSIYYPDEAVGVPIEKLFFG